MWFLYLLSWLSFLIQICFVTLSIGKFAENVYLWHSFLLTILFITHAPFIAPGNMSLSMSFLGTWRLWRWHWKIKRLPIFENTEAAKPTMHQQSLDTAIWILRHISATSHDISYAENCRGPDPAPNLGLGLEFGTTCKNGFTRWQRLNWEIYLFAHWVTILV